TFTELAAEHPKLFVVVTFNVTCPVAPAVNVMLCVFAGGTIVPFEMVQAYVLAEELLALLVSEFALTLTGAVIIGAVAAGFTVTAVAADVPVQPLAFVAVTL